MANRPLFLLTYWNPFNKDAPGLGQSFLNYVKDVSLADYTANVTGNLVGSYIENASREQISELRHGFAFLDQRLAKIEQQQINTNILLENIGELLKVPDSEKQRQRHIELGLKFSNQALKDEDLAIDAKLEFDAALSIMPQDWFVLQQLGMLHLYHEKVSEIGKAKDNFLQAAKYAKADSETKGSVFINDLFKLQLSKPFSEQIEDNSEVLKDFVRECYLSAALSSYILSQFDEAVIIAKKSSSQHPKSLFLTAKYLSRAGNKEESFEYLKSAIEKAPYYCEAAQADVDLISLPQLNNYSNKVFKEFDSKLEKIKPQLFQIKEFVSNDHILALLQLPNKFISNTFELLTQSLSAKRKAENERSWIEGIESSPSNFSWNLEKFLDYISMWKEINPDDLRRREGFDESTAFYLIGHLENAGVIPINKDYKNLRLSRSDLVKEAIECYSKNFYGQGNEKKYLLENYQVMDLENEEKLSFIKKIIESYKQAEENGIKEFTIIKEQIQSEQKEKIAKELLEKQKEKSPCFIATATLGDYNHPIVIDLKNFRDTWLLQNSWGKSFVKWYYKQGPKAAKVISKYAFLQTLSLWCIIKPLHFLTRVIHKV